MARAVMARATQCIVTTRLPIHRPCSSIAPAGAALAPAAAATIRGLGPQAHLRRPQRARVDGTRAAALTLTLSLTPPLTLSLILALTQTPNPTPNPTLTLTRSMSNSLPPPHPRRPPASPPPLLSPLASATNAVQTLPFPWIRGAKCVGGRWRGKVHTRAQGTDGAHAHAHHVAVYHGCLLIMYVCLYKLSPLGEAKTPYSVLIRLLGFTLRGSRPPSFVFTPLQVGALLACLHKCQI